VAGRSARNYPHLVASALRLDLVDVTYSGATTAHVLRDRQFGAPPQVESLDGSETLVTVTIGGNDVGYVPLLTAACLPWPAQWVPLLGCRIRQLRDRSARDRALHDVSDALRDVGDTVRGRARQARVLFVDYLTLLPPAGRAASPMSNADADLGAIAASNRLPDNRVDEVLARVGLSDVAGKKAGLTVHGDGAVLLVSGVTTEQIGELATGHGVTLHELSPPQASLEEAYMKLTDDSMDYRADHQESGVPS
jgi:GDSL-like Lipase/Acylhydrolase family